MKTKVRTVDSVELTIASVTGRITVTAMGTVATGGWSNAELVDTPHPPEDENHHFDFVATAPTGIAVQVISPIAAQRTVQAGGGNYCVIVHATSNSQGPDCLQVEIGRPI